MSYSGAIDERAKNVIQASDNLFGKKMTLLSLWQEQADNFYVERADFTRVRTLGQDFAANLMTSYPLLVRRDLQNTISTMLRPTNVQWFSMQTNHADNESRNARAWLEWASSVMRRAMKDPRSSFTKATKEADGDYVTFGQAVIQPTMSIDGTRLLFRTWHLRDCAWREGYDTRVNEVHRKWKPTLKDFVERFKDKVSPKARLAYDGKKPEDLYKEIEVRHIVVPAECYEPPAGQKQHPRHGFVSMYVEIEDEWITEEIPVPRLGYVLPRWQTVSGSQYAFSPCTVVGLPDARLIQAMTRVLLEAGEKATNPPMIGIQEVLRSDLNIYAGGFTAVDSTFDGKLEDALRPITQDTKNLPTGLEMRNDQREMLQEAFFLNKLNLPPADGAKMTAYEVNQRIQEYIRNATPLFEPIEDEYNGALCEETFALMMSNGGFGPLQAIPDELRGQEIQFQFVSPITQAIGADKGQKFDQVANLIAQAQELDPGIGAEVDPVTALRDTLDGIGTPAKWLRSEADAQAIRQQQSQEQQQQAEIAHASQVADVAQKAGAAAQSVNTAMGNTPT